MHSNVARCILVGRTLNRLNLTRSALIGRAAAREVHLERDKTPLQLQFFSALQCIYHHVCICRLYFSVGSVVGREVQSGQLVRGEKRHA